MIKKLRNRFPDATFEVAFTNELVVTYKNASLIVDKTWGLNESIKEINDFIRDINIELEQKHG
jgi:hypothetical protein